MTASATNAANLASLPVNASWRQPRPVWWIWWQKRRWQILAEEAWWDTTPWCALVTETFMTNNNSTDTGRCAYRFRLLHSLVMQDVHWTSVGELQSWPRWALSWLECRTLMARYKKCSPLLRWWQWGEGKTQNYTDLHRCPVVRPAIMDSWEENVILQCTCMQYQKLNM